LKLFEAVHIMVYEYPSEYLFKNAISKGTQNGLKALLAVVDRESHPCLSPSRKSTAAEAVQTAGQLDRGSGWHLPWLELQGHTISHREMVFALPPSRRAKEGSLSERKLNASGGRQEPPDT
jgi:hypothetical protein